MVDESGKSRALRISLDYHTHRGWLYWSRWGAAIAALCFSGSYGLFVLAGAWLPSRNEFSSVWKRQAAMQVSTGPLSNAHAHLEQECQHCHDTSMLFPIAADAFKLDPSGSIGRLSAACQHCHAAASHVANIADPSCRLVDQNCSVCHAEHLGRVVDPSAVASGQCTNCHADLQAACDLVHMDLNLQINKFSNESHSVEGSGQFRSLIQDSGRVKFDHAQHLRPGQVENDQRGGFRTEMLPERWQMQYQSDPNGFVQLSCGDCHRPQTQTGEVHQNPQKSAVAFEGFRFYSPIDFEQHCAACHQFTFPRQKSEMSLPHAVPRAEIASLLKVSLSGGNLDENRSARTGLNKGSSGDRQTAAELEEVVVQSTIANIYSGCVKCHLPSDITEEEIRKRLQRLSPNPMIPHRWLRRGLFDHGAHEKISNCQFCHEVRSRNGSSDDQAPNDNEYVMIKGPESCTPCHRSANDRSQLDLSSGDARQSLLGEARQPSLASDNCAYCHRYHWSFPASSSSLETGGDAP